MKRSRGKTRVLAVLMLSLAGALLSTRTVAQSPGAVIPVSSARNALWVFAGVGTGNMVDAGILSAHVGVSGARDRAMVTARGLGATDLAITYEELALLAGRRGLYRSYISAQAGLAWGKLLPASGSVVKRGLGLALELGAHAQASGLGLAVKGLATIGPRHMTHATLALSVEVGNFGKRRVDPFVLLPRP